MDYFFNEEVSFTDRIERLRNKFWDKDISGRRLEELVQRDQLVEGVTSFDMFKCTADMQVKMDVLFVEDTVQFQRVVQLLTIDYVPKRRFVRWPVTFMSRQLMFSKIWRNGS